MTPFWAGIAALCAVALAFLLVPLWRQRRSSGRWSLSAVLAAALVVPIAVLLYRGIETWQPELQQQRAQETALVDQLARRMAQQPEDVEGWRLLGRSYVVLGEYDAASRAFAEALQRTPAPDNDLKLAYAEAEILADRNALGAEAGALVEEVLAEEPANPKALWYGGQRSIGLGDMAAARTRLTTLLNMGPPEEVAQVLRAQLAQLPAAEGGSAGPAVASAAGPKIDLRVRLGEDVSTADLGPQAALFVFAQDPRGGPPVAVIRAPASAVPGDFVLSDQNTMLPGRSLGDYEELNLVARISASGQPLEQSGDLYAERSYRPGEATEPLELVIDKLVE